MNQIFIYDAVRTVRGRGKPGGALYECRSLWLLQSVLESLRQRHEFITQALHDVIIGCVTAVGEQGANIARTAILAADYPETIPGLQINRFCASGLEAISLAMGQALMIEAGFFIAGGVESMSRVPMSSDGGALAVDPSVAAKHRIVPQGVAADLIASLQGFSREELDKFALQSQQRASAVQDISSFSKIAIQDINGLPLLEQDECVRQDTTLQGLQELKPSFFQMGRNFGFDQICIQKYPQLEFIEHHHTAGNSSALADGAAALLLGRASLAKKYKIPQLARIRSTASVGSEPTIMLTGVVPAIELALKRAGMAVEDIDIWEINEAFASVVLNCQHHFNIPADKLNPWGGAIALGHPLGATGAMLVATALDQLLSSDKKTALIALCVAGGMGTAMIIEKGDEV